MGTQCDWARVSVNSGLVLVTREKTSVLHFKVDGRMRKLVIRGDVSTELCYLWELIWELGSVNISGKAGEKMIDS